MYNEQIIYIDMQCFIIIVVVTTVVIDYNFFLSLSVRECNYLVVII